MTSITIECCLPPIEASPNRQSYWAAKAEAIKEYRLDCKVRIAQAWREWQARGERPIEYPVTVDLDFYLCRKPELACDAATALRIAYRRGYYPKDADNARSSCKALQDAIVDVGVIPNDSAKYLHLGETRLHATTKTHSGRACVVVTISSSKAST